MGFLLNGQPLAAGRPFTDSQGTQYPANWLQLATDDEKDAVGITWEDDPAPVDKQFYSGRDADGNAIAKSLVDVNQVDENGDPVLDENGNQYVQLGLKTQLVAKQKQQAAALLAGSDWYVTRKAEDSTAEIPAAVLTYRASVRTISGTREGEINACTTVAELEALMTNPAKVLNDSGEWIANTEPFLTPWPEQA